MTVYSAKLSLLCQSYFLFQQRLFVFSYVEMCVVAYPNKFIQVVKVKPPEKWRHFSIFVEIESTTER